MIPLLVSADQVVSALVSDQPLAVDEGDYNLDIKVGHPWFPCFDVSHVHGRALPRKWTVMG